MQTEEIISAGIDIGTSTTQLVFSKMILQNVGGFGRIPQIKVISKKIIYRSRVYFTPLSSMEEIDGKRVNEIIKEEYRKAGIRPEDLSTGAVIITGETSRKRNAKSVLKEISDVAGDFVVATAGADLESVLAGKGAGASDLSKKTGLTVVNLDIGGGTTNICLFKDGKDIDVACMDIGGRLIKIEDNKISYVAPKVQWLSKQLNIDISNNDDADIQKLRKITDAMAQILAESVNLTEKSIYTDKMKTNHLFEKSIKPDIITFSGGVAACFDECRKNDKDIFKFGDIGILLASSILNNSTFNKADVRNSRETMRATVIGAGNYSMNISGSTIEYSSKCFPMKNIPVVKVQLEEDQDIDSLDINIHKQMNIYYDEKEEKKQVAIAMKGLKCPTFKQIQKIAQKIYRQYEKECEFNRSLIIILEEDIGKAVGQALEHLEYKIKEKRNIVCIDGIRCDNGDYVDLGEPVASGNVVPVVVKTLIFNG